MQVTTLFDIPRWTGNGKNCRTRSFRGPATTTHSICELDQASGGGCCEKKPIMILNVDQTLWKYRAEGNANVVLAMLESRKVLRLKKVDADQAPHRDDANESFKFLKFVVDYIKDISTMFLDDFLIAPQLVILLIKDLDRFNKQLNQYRPVERLTKAVRFPFGILYPDVTFLPTYLTTSAKSEATFCVEIKPKQGWRFNGSVEDERHFQRLFQVDRSLLSKCRFCAMQFLKYKKGKINTLSSYCPLELFSGHPRKMANAIKNLIECPQNNLRIFRNGDQVYGDHQYYNADRLHNTLEEIFSSKDRHRNLQQFMHLLSTILLKEYTPSGTPPPMRERGGNLPANCVLQQVLNVQRLVYDFFASMDLNKVLGTNVVKGDWRNCDRNRIIEDLLTTSKFQRYRCGATALDCSLMITFQRLASSAQPTIDEALGDKFVVEQDRVRFMTKIAIMDLDPKPFTHAVKYVEQTQASYLHTQCSQSIL